MIAMNASAPRISVSPERVQWRVDEQVEPLLDREPGLPSSDSAQESGIRGFEIWVFLERLIDGGHEGALVVCFQ